MTNVPQDLPRLPTLGAGTQKVIDAREMLATGQYTATDPSGVVPEGTVVEPEKPPEVEHDPAPQVTEAKKRAEAEHSPGVPLNATSETSPSEAPVSKKAPVARKTRKNTPKEE